MTIAHISDLHFGRIAHPDIVTALVDDVNDDGIDLVAVSGDLTQRARRREFRAAREMLNAIDRPVLVVPGNHDVFPWWMPMRRLRAPLQRYRAFVTDDLAPTYRSDGVTVLGVNSAFGETIKSGRITSGALATIRETFAPVQDDHFNVLVVHHHLTHLRALGWHDVVRRAEEALSLTADVGVDLVLCGHLHISHVEALSVGRRRVVIASAGTATSDRGRKSNRATNFYNRITVGDTHFSIEERRYVPSARSFVQDGTIAFDREGVPTRQ